MSEQLLIPKQDMDYLLSQDAGSLNMIVAGMNAVINDNRSHTEAMKNQKWFQRMVKTVSGQNKATTAIIRENHEKLNIYAVQALGELYKHQKISQEIIINIGNRMNELYVSHLKFMQKTGRMIIHTNQRIEDTERRFNERIDIVSGRVETLEQYNRELRIALAEFADRLRNRIERTEKRIDSVENFNLLSKDIEQGHFSDSTPMVSIYRILAHMDRNILDDNRKLGIIQRDMEKVGILTKEALPIDNYLLELMTAPDEQIGIIYTELLNHHGGDSRLMSLTTEALELWNFESEANRSIMNRDKVVRYMLDKHCIDDGATISGSDVFVLLTESKRSLIIDIPVSEPQAYSRPQVVNTQENSPDLTELIKVYKIFVNSDVLWADNADVFFESFTQYCNAKNVRILLSRDAEEVISHETGYMYNLFSRLAANDFIELRPEKTNADVNNVIQKVFAQSNTTMKIMLITQDESLAQTILSQYSGNSKRIIAGYVDEHGSLQLYK